MGGRNGKYRSSGSKMHPDNLIIVCTLKGSLRCILYISLVSLSLLRCVILTASTAMRPTACLDLKRRVFLRLRIYLRCMGCVTWSLTCNQYNGLRTQHGIMNSAVPDSLPTKSSHPMNGDANIKGMSDSLETSIWKRALIVAGFYVVCTG